MFNSQVITLLKLNDHQRQEKGYVYRYVGKEACKISTTAHTRTSLFVVLIGLDAYKYFRRGEENRKKHGLDVPSKENLVVASTTVVGPVMTKPKRPISEGDNEEDPFVYVRQI